jgi:hypothetical protein
MGTGSFLGVKRPACGVEHPPLSNVEVKERVDLYLYFPSGPSWPVLGETLPLSFASGLFYSPYNYKYTNYLFDYLIIGVIIHLI